MMKRVLLLVTLLAIALAGARARQGGQTGQSGQATPSLQEQMQQAQEQLHRAQDDLAKYIALLAQNQGDQKVTQTQLKLIEGQIGSRKRIIASLEGQIALLGSDISNKNNTIESLRSQLDTLRAEYAQMVRVAYKNYKLNNFALFVFSAEDFNDATRRIAFIDRYNRSREQKAAQIDSLSARLGAQVVELNARKAKLDQTKAKRGREVASLADDQTIYRNSAATLKANESKLKKEANARRAQIASAQQQIRRIVAEEARKAQTAKRSATEEKEMVALDGRFDQNMGRLPFPVRGGVIVDSYGVHAHAVAKGTKIDNRGINIAAPRGSEVKCVFDGEVKRVFMLQGMGNNVIVGHGSYITVYANLASVSVKQGDKVKTEQRLGAIADSDDSDQCQLHFEMWRGYASIDPTLWLARR